MVDVTTIAELGTARRDPDPRDRHLRLGPLARDSTPVVASCSLASQGTRTRLSGRIPDSRHSTRRAVANGARLVRAGYLEIAPDSTKPLRDAGASWSSGGGIRTRDLRVMRSPCLVLSGARWLSHAVLDALRCAEFRGACSRSRSAKAFVGPGNTRTDDVAIARSDNGRRPATGSGVSRRGG
jgi:hypothetical protein